MNVVEMARAERADVAELLETLRPDQPNAPALCAVGGCVTPLRSCRATRPDREL